MLDALRRVWKLSPDMQLRASVQASYLSMLPKPLVGIHIRSGDSEDQAAERDPLWYQKQPWVDNLRELLARNGLDLQSGGTCLMYGDHLLSLGEAAAALKVTMRCNTILVGGSPQGHHQETFNAENQTVACDATRDMILALDAMSRTDIFMGDFDSNLPDRLLLLLRSMYGKSEATSGDVSGTSHNWHHNNKVAGNWHAAMRVG